MTQKRVRPVGGLVEPGMGRVVQQKNIGSSPEHLRIQRQNVPDLKTTKAALAATTIAMKPAAVCIFMNSRFFFCVPLLLPGRATDKGPLGFVGGHL